MLRRLLLVLALLGAALVWSSAPAQAAVRVVQLTQDGPQPAVLQVARGDRVRFTNADSFPHAVRSDSGSWEFRSPSLAPGESYEVPRALTAPGVYRYVDDELLSDYAGEVVVPAGAATARPAPSRSSPPPRPSASAGPGAPEPDGAERTVAPPSAVPTSSAAPPTGPAVAPPPGRSSGMPSPTGSPVATAVAGGRLAQPPTVRGYGLPVALAVVGAAGTATLLVRVLLAHPAARRPTA